MLRYPIRNPLIRCLFSLMDTLLKLLLRPKPRPSAPPPQKILLCNGGHLGDLVLTTALLPILREHYPHAKIGVLIGSWARCVVENHPLVDQIHCVDHWKLNRSQKGFLHKWLYYRNSKKRALQELKANGYGLALDCRFHFPNMAPLLWQAKIKDRRGFITAGFSAFLTRAYPWDPEQDLPATLVFLSLLTSDSQSPPRACLSVVSLPKESYLVLHLGVNATTRSWPLGNWQQLAQRLSEEGETLFFTGTGSREAMAIKQVMQGLAKSYSLCDQLTWQEFVEVIQRARLLLSIDTCAGHVASAVSTPSVLLYRGIHPMQIWSPLGSHILTQSVACAPCLWGCSEPRCVQEITVEGVYQKVRTLLPRPLVMLKEKRYPDLTRK